MIYRFRIVLDVLDDVFRDIEVRESSTLEDLHNIICQSFGFEGSEMASFYLSDEEWNQGEEFVLFDMDDGNPVKMMNEVLLGDILSENQTKLIYIYDFINMWTFYVELAEILEPQEGQNYPNLLFAHGVLPDTPPEKKFEAEEDEFNDFNDQGFDDLDKFDFDERWN